MRSLLAVLNYLGSQLTWFALLFLVPIAVGLSYGELQSLAGFYLGGAITVFAGLVLRITTQRFGIALKPRDAFVLICVSYFILAAVAATPFLWLQPHMSFTRAYFEAISGLTTTGATMITGLDHLPHAFNVWRHLLSWVGGLGVIVMAIAVLPLLGIGGMQLYRASAPGPVKDARLTPRILEAIRTFAPLYAALTAVCALALWYAGMNFFDAVCHAMSALSLGGFSTHDANIAFFLAPGTSSAGIELVLMAFMLVAATNFSTHYTAFRKGDFDAYRRDHESRWMLLLVLGSCFAVAALLTWRGVHSHFLHSLRLVSFNVISMATDAGLYSSDYGTWPVFAPMWMLFLSCLCANSGSAGGGIRMFRSLILIKQSLREMFTLVHPQAVRPLKISGQIVPNDVAYSVLAFIFLYFVAIAMLTFVLLISGLDFMTAFSAIIACINNLGRGLGAVGPGHTYGAMNDFQSWVCTLAMIIGRVDIVTFAVLCTPAYWRK